MIDVEDYERMIKKLAWGCYQRLPSHSYSLEGLEQEGRWVYVKLLRRKLKPDGASFSTLLFKALINRYKDIVKSCYTQKRKHDRVTYQEVNLVSTVRSPQKLLELKEIIDYISFYNSGLAEYFLHGPSNDLLKYAEDRANRRAVKRGKKKAEKVVIHKRCLEEFFGIDFQDIVLNFNIGRKKFSSK